MRVVGSSARSHGLTPPLTPGWPGRTEFVRGAAMPARVKDAHEREDIIAYLRSMRADADGL